MGLKFQSLLVNCLRKIHKLAFTYIIIVSIGISWSTRLVPITKVSEKNI